MVDSIILKWITAVLIVLWIGWLIYVEKKQFNNWEGYSLRDKLLFSTKHFTILMMIVGVVFWMWRTYL